MNAMLLTRRLLSSNMAAFLYKIRCPDPDHEDSAPSCAVYSDGTGFCFSCNKYFKDLVEPAKEVIKHVEDINEKIKYIENLPTTNTRGLVFPFDNDGYYIVWPNRDYYKLRRWTSIRGGDKYLSPSGHRKPVFGLLAPKVSQELIIVEGEINALSLHSQITHIDIACPGSASSFTDATMLSVLPDLVEYATILIVVDADVAGLTAALKLKELLQQNVLDVTIKLLEKDFNELLIDHGKDFKDKLKSMDLPKWVFND